MKTTSESTPLMKQYFTIKEQYPDAFVLFQVGDFYELFFDDAQKAASFLGIALTKRGHMNGEPIPLCGVPVHARDHYVVKLVKGGFKVVICDQLEEARPGKVVDRGVTHVLTPGTLTDTKLLDEKSASYLLSFFPLNDSWGLIFAELLTAQLFATVLPARAQKTLESELIRFFPDEIILPAIPETKTFEHYFKQLGYFTTPIANGFEHDGQLQQIMSQQFAPDVQQQVASRPALQQALYYFFHYIQRTQQDALQQFRTLHLYESDDFLVLDAATQTNLELIKNSHDGSRRHTLFETVDGAMTPMGSRMIKKWIQRPLVNIKSISQRQDTLQVMVTDIIMLQKLEQLLSALGDIERIVGRIAIRRGMPYDYLQLQKVLEKLPDIAQVLMPYVHTPLLHGIMMHLGDFSPLCALLAAALHDDRSKEWIIKQGFDQQLDKTRELVEHGARNILALEQHEQRLTGIGSLKIRYNQVHGYYIEVTNTHKDAIPARYIRQQTLVGRERFITQELQQLQHEILRAQAEITALEQAVYERIKQAVHEYITPLRKLAHALAHLDALLGLARISYSYKYVRPLFNETQSFMLTNSRHPVIERLQEHTFIPNDLQLSHEQSTLIITGPNMGGKSTYLRQVALTTIMAQIGCFVPADSADIPLVDRIFTRIGAGDNLAEGKSTFLVEMEETAAICMQATEKSLVILDEVGRGTSTFDGLALAQAVVEYIHTVLRARCLFATHYQELTLLAAQIPGIANYHAANKRTDTGIMFLYKMIPGSAQGSFGIEVAKLADMPSSIIARAQEILGQLQKGDSSVMVAPTADTSDHIVTLTEHVLRLQHQLQLKEKHLQQLRSIDYDQLSPKKAFDLLWQLKEMQ